jgi:hypothetical protein
MMASDFMPARFGNCLTFASSMPVTAAQEPSVIAPAQPVVTMASSQPISSASRAPTLSCSSSRTTYWRDAAAMASCSSGHIFEAPITVWVPRQLITGRMPNC